MAGDINKLCLNCLRYGLDEQRVCRFCGKAFSVQTEKPFHLPPGEILAGKYIVARVLGEGGFGITYLGWDINLELKVAIKEYYPSSFVARDSTTTSAVSSFGGGANDFFLKGRERFVDEARSLARFHHLSGIVQVRDFFSENGTAYIVMEFLEGVTLKERLDAAGGRLPEAEVLALMKPLVESLALVHAAGVIHRDISPDNLILTPAGHLKLLDFGAARDFSDDNRSLSVLLKPGYAPEEQYRSHGQQGPWTDIYALCATLYRAIEGVKPPEALERAMEDTLTGFSVPVSQSTANAIMTGLAVRQQNRWQRIEDLMPVLYPAGGPGAGGDTPQPATAPAAPQAMHTQGALYAAQTPQGPPAYPDAPAQAGNPAQGGMPMGGGAHGNMPVPRKKPGNKALPVDGERDYTEFAGRDIAVITAGPGGVTSLAIEANPIYFRDSTEAVEAVRQGHVAGLIYELTAVRAMAEQMEGFEAIPIPKAVFSTQMAGISGSQAAIDSFNAFLGEAEGDGTLDDMKRRWVGEARTWTRPSRISRTVAKTEHWRFPFTPTPSPMRLWAQAVSIRASV